jgi:hypothetical protein
MQLMLTFMPYHAVNMKSERETETNVSRSLAMDYDEFIWRTTKAMKQELLIPHRERLQQRSRSFEWQRKQL